MNRIRKVARELKLLALDVDGVLTDGNLHYGPDGEVVKVFNTLDGHGLKLLQREGIVLAIVSGRTSTMLQKRAQDLGIQHLIMGREDKKAALSALLAQLGISPEHAGYMGDDLPDLGAILWCGLGVAPANAHATVRQEANLVTQLRGGEGAVRELCDFILECRGRLGAIINDYRQDST